MIACSRPARSAPLVLATTTSVANSGLLDTLLRTYHESIGTEVHPQLVGSGLALKMLGDGHADLVISHAPAAEATALGAHPRWDYRKIMFNDFVLVGPAADPARVADAAHIVDAMRRIAGSQARFLSRGDSSGTHEREQQLWARAGVAPPNDRLVVAGTGMGGTLRAASETGAYTLTDRATFTQMKDALRLTVLFEGGSLLLNTYAVVVDPGGARGKDATALASWLSDGAGRRAIENYRIGGAQAFRIWPERARSRPEDTPF